MVNNVSEMDNVLPSFLDHSYFTKFWVIHPKFIYISVNTFTFGLYKFWSNAFIQFKESF